MLIRRNKFRKDRSLLQNTWNLKKSPFNKRKYKPGIHRNKNTNYTIYGNLLQQKQRLRAFYFNIKDHQLKNILIDSIKYKNYKEVVIRKLESRLDTILFRSGFASTFSMAKQLINHKQVFVNSKVANSPSFSVKNGDKITIKQNMQTKVKENILKVNRKVPSYILITRANCSIVFMADSLPKQESELGMNSTQIDDIMRYYGI